MGDDQDYVEITCSACGDLTDSAGTCYTCSAEYSDVRKDFKFEYAHESISEKYSRFKKVQPFYERN